MTRLYKAAARWPLRSEPQNSHDFLPRAIDRSFCHIGQEVEIHYCWHPLYGRRVRQHYSALPH
jgi:hypothetical protein